MTSRIAQFPLMPPKRGTGISIDELGKAYDRVNRSGVAGPDVMQLGDSGSYIPDDPTTEVLALIGGSSGTEPVRWEWWEVFFDENRELIKVNPDNPNGNIDTEDEEFNYVVDPTGSIKEGDYCWIKYNELHGFWVVKSILASATDNIFPARLISGSTTDGYYSWEEQYFDTNGNRQVLSGGRSGNQTAGTQAFIINGNKKLNVDLPHNVYLKEIKYTNSAGTEVTKYEIITHDEDNYIRHYFIDTSSSLPNINSSAAGGAYLEYTNWHCYETGATHSTPRTPGRGWWYITLSMPAYCYTEANSSSPAKGFTLFVTLGNTYGASASVCSSFAADSDGKYRAYGIGNVSAYVYTSGSGDIPVYYHITYLPTPVVGIPTFTGYFQPLDGIVGLSTRPIALLTMIRISKDGPSTNHTYPDYTE